MASPELVDELALLVVLVVCPSPPQEQKDKIDASPRPVTWTVFFMIEVLLGNGTVMVQFMRVKTGPFHNEPIDLEPEDLGPFHRIPAANQKRAA